MKLFRHRQRGFSLTEVTVVITIAATLAAVAIVKTTASSQTVRLKAAAKRLQADIEYAQELAMNLGREVQVRFPRARGISSCTSAPETTSPCNSRGRIYRATSCGSAPTGGPIIREVPSPRSVSWRGWAIVTNW